LEEKKANLEERIKRETELMLRKQYMSEEKRQQFEEIRKISLQKKSEEAQKKQEEIQKTLIRCKEIEEMKIYEFNKKMEDMEKQKKIIEKMKEEDMVQRQIEAKNRELKLIQAREEKERLDNLKKDFVVAKISETEFKIKRMREAKEIESMQKNEKNILMRTEKEMNIKRIENMKEFERQKQLEKLEENYRKAEEFRDQKNIIAEKKKEINMEIALQKKIMVGKLENYLAKNKEITVIINILMKLYIFILIFNINKTFQPEALKELFPGDEKLYEKALAMREQMMMSKSQFRSEIKTRGSINNLKSQGNFNNTVSETSLNKNKLYDSATKLDDLKKNINITYNQNLSLENDVNINTKSNNKFTIENGGAIKGNNTGNPKFLTADSGFGPVIKTEGNKKPKKNGENFELLRSNILNSNTDVLNTNQKYTERDIEKMAQDYKSKMNVELLKILQEEKYREEEREVLYHNTIDIIEKKRLEKIISMERAQSSERIMKLNEYLILFSILKLFILILIQILKS